MDLSALIATILGGVVVAEAIIIWFLIKNPEKSPMVQSSPDVRGRVIQTPNGAFVEESAKRGPVLNDDNALWEREN